MADTHARLLELLPRQPDAHDAQARLVAGQRPIRYPFGSGQAEEVALRAGLKPAIRQRLDDPRRSRQRHRFEHLGFRCLEVGDTLIVARDAPTAAAIAACEGAQSGGSAPRSADVAAAVLEQGLLLGYPRCCVKAYVQHLASHQVSRSRGASTALSVTRRAFEPRLNVLDMRLFHYICWVPCGFDCDASLCFADGVASVIQRQHKVFVQRVDYALGANRLVVDDDVQISVTGSRDGPMLLVDRAWPTFRDHHPDAASLTDAAREAAIRLTAAVTRGGALSVSGDALTIRGQASLEWAGLQLYPFGCDPPARL